MSKKVKIVWRHNGNVTYAKQEIPKALRAVAAELKPDLADTPAEWIEDPAALRPGEEARLILDLRSIFTTATVQVFRRSFILKLHVRGLAAFAVRNVDLEARVREYLERFFPGGDPEGQS